MGMWKLLRVLVILPVAFAVGAARHSGVATVAAQQITTVMPQNLQPVPNRQLPTAERLAQLHNALISDGDPHDVALEIARIGDATSVPFLIEALAKQGTVPRDGGYVAICTRFHVLEALQAITNHDAGPNAEDWQPWYDTNKAKTQEQWIKDGFAEHGFPVSDPPDDAFVAALIRACDPKYQPPYVRTNALRMLRRVAPDTVVRLTQRTSASAETGPKRGTVAALETVDGTIGLQILRTLKNDTDVDVAENALRALNDGLRLTLPTIPTQTVWELANTGGRVLHVLNDHTVILGMGSDEGTRVVAFDLVVHNVTWSYPTADAVGSNAVQIGDRLYFVSDDRVLHCISIYGKPLWAKALTSSPDLGKTGPAIVAASGRLFVPDDKSVYVATPDGQIQTYTIGEQVSRSLVGGRRRVFAAVHNGPLLVFDDAGKPPTRVNTGLKTAALSAGGDTICVVSFGPACQLQCLEQETLHELWRVDLPNEGYVLEQDDENVYALAQGRALAFDVGSGKRLWATNEFTSFAPFKLMRGVVLTRNLGRGLEWRDRFSGEVIASWEKRNGSYASDAEMVGENVLIEVHDLKEVTDGLRLVKFPEAVKQRLRLR